MSAADLSVSERSELACSYASLILHDDKVDVNAEKISAILKAANVNVEAFYPALFAKVLAKKSVDDLVDSIGSAGGAPVAAAAAGAAAPSGGAAPASGGAAPAKKAPEPEKEESDEEMGFGLFD